MNSASSQSNARFAAPPGGKLDAAMRAAFDTNGYLVLEDFVPHAACDALRARAHELVDAFDPASVRSVFSTTEQTQLADRYFLESGDKIRFFLEKDAFDEAGKLTGLLTLKDTEKSVLNPQAVKDELGRLRVAAASTVGDAGSLNVALCGFYASGLGAAQPAKG